MNSYLVEGEIRKAVNAYNAVRAYVKALREVPLGIRVELSPIRGRDPLEVGDDGVVLVWIGRRPRIEGDADLYISVKRVE